MTRADELNERRRRIDPPANAPTSQRERPEVVGALGFRGLVLIRSLDVAGKTMTAQRVHYTDGAQTTRESQAGVDRHAEAFGPKFRVYPAPGVPYSYMNIRGLVVDRPDDPEPPADPLPAEDLGANFVVCKLYAGDIVEPWLKIPGAAFTDADAQTTEGGTL